MNFFEKIKIKIPYFVSISAALVIIIIALINVIWFMMYGVRFIDNNCIFMGLCRGICAGVALSWSINELKMVKLFEKPDEIIKDVSIKIDCIKEKLNEQKKRDQSTETRNQIR